MYRKILSLLLSVVFLFAVPVTTYAERKSHREDISKNAPSSLQKSTVSKVFFAIKNNPEYIIFGTFAIFGLYLSYTLLLGQNQDCAKPALLLGQNASCAKPSLLIGENQDCAEPPSAHALLSADINCVPVGLKRLGFSCYVITAIQQLFRNDKFRKFILVQGDDINETDSPYTWATYRFFKSMITRNPLPDAILEKCLKMLGYDGRQADSCLCFLNIANMCLQEKNKGKKENEKEKDIFCIPDSHLILMGMAREGESLVDVVKLNAIPDNLQICHRVENNNPKLTRLSNEFEEYSKAAVAALAKPRTDEMAKAAQQQVRTEHPGLAKAYDELNVLKAEAVVKTTPQYFLPTEILTSGNEVIFRVNRWDYNSNKLFPVHRLNTPDTIDLRVDFDIPDGKKYKLSHAMVHFGTQKGGHYVSFVRVGEQWYKINDDHVEPVTYEQAKSDIETRATMVFYAEE
ncbi:MAG: hypothetical protein LBR79_04715 [Oscillospiraceae bacterium]|jgi:hypothetical protein|nr:hypothetical protein [Oscillospiraceae bacterium]